MTSSRSHEDPLVVLLRDARVWAEVDRSTGSPSAPRMHADHTGGDGTDEQGTPSVS